MICTVAASKIAEPIQLFLQLHFHRSRRITSFNSRTLIFVPVLMLKLGVTLTPGQNSFYSSEEQFSLSRSSECLSPERRVDGRKTGTGQHGANCIGLESTGTDRGWLISLSTIHSGTFGIVSCAGLHHLIVRVLWARESNPSSLISTTQSV